LELNIQFASNNPKSILLTNIKTEQNESVEDINAVITEVLNDIKSNKKPMKTTMIKTAKISMMKLSLFCMK